jgi:hypothetical protein
VSAPSGAQSNQRLLPSSGPISPPSVSIPSQPSPWSGQTYASQPAPAATVTIPPPSTIPPPMAQPAVGPTTTPALAPVGPQPDSQPIGPTLRPAAAIPAPPMQGQCYPCYPRNPCYQAVPCYQAAPRYQAAPCDPNCSLAGRQRIVRPLQAGQCTPCPAGTMPVPCVPSYNPCRPSGSINLTDLPEPKSRL